MASMLVCPLCEREAPRSYYDIGSANQLRCRCCRGTFTDPETYDSQTDYADYDGRQLVHRFPYRLGGRRTVIRVARGYLAVAIGHDARMSWFHPGNNALDLNYGQLQLYYICCQPWVLWGTQGVREFGAHGEAELNLDPEHVIRICSSYDKLLSLERTIREKVNAHMDSFVRQRATGGQLAMLREGAAYQGAIADLEPGISITRVAPQGYRAVMKETGEFTGYTIRVTEAPAQYVQQPQILPTITLHTPPTYEYTIRRGVEEVHVHRRGGMERHKAGELIRLDELRQLETIVCFEKKEFSLDYGWGVYNMTTGPQSYFCAHGTMTLYVDRTEKLTPLLRRAGEWSKFQQLIFTNVISNRLAETLQGLMPRYMASKDFDPEDIRQHLSAISVTLGNRLNGDDYDNSERPAFRDVGLRVKSVDVMHMSFYADRR